MSCFLMVAAAEYDIDARIRREAEGLVQAGHDVNVICLKGPSGAENRTLNGVRIRHLNCSKYRGKSIVRYAILYVAFMMQAEVALLRTPAHAVIFHSMPEWLVWLAVPKRARGVPVLLDVHDLSSELFRAKFQSEKASLGLRILRKVVAHLETRSITYADHVLTVHHRYASMIEERCRLEPGSVTVVMNAPDERYFAHYRDRYWTDAPTFSYHGTLARRFGVLELVDAFEQVLALIPRARLEIRGGGDSREEINELIRRLGISDSVTVSDGPVPVEQLADELQDAHISVAPMVTDSFTTNALPTKVLDAAAIGLPVIATDNPILRTYFSDGSINYSPDSTPESLAKVMCEVAGDPADARRRARAAKRDVDAISWRQQFATLRRVVEGVTAEAPSSGTS